jgi:hypothetical protein
VARAKNTDRAEARRRHRAAMAAADAAAGAAMDDDGAPVPSVSAAAAPREARPSGASKSAPATPTQRPSITQAFRIAFQPANVREDIRTFPSVVRSTPQVLIAPALVLVGAVFLLVPTLRDSQIGSLAAQLLVVPPPLIPAFLAGMLAPRASWLFGLLVGLLAGVFFAAYVVTAPATGVAPVTDDLRAQALLYAVVVSPLFGLATGAFAGFYRRFLRVSAPQQQRKPASKSQKASGKSGR